MSRHKRIVSKLDPQIAIYLAGLIDGEATFYISQSRKHYKGTESRVYSPQFKLVLTHEGVIKYLSKQLGITYTHVKGNPNKNHKDSYVIRVGNFEGIISLIEQVLPHLIVKKETAETMLAFCISRRDNWEVSPYNKVPYTEHELSLFEKIKRLNRVGIPVELGGYSN